MLCGGLVPACGRQAPVPCGGEDTENIEIFLYLNYRGGYGECPEIFIPVSKVAQDALNRHNGLNSKMLAFIFLMSCPIRAAFPPLKTAMFGQALGREKLHLAMN
jgi:hypothetical protein